MSPLPPLPSWRSAREAWSATSESTSHSWLMTSRLPAPVTMASTSPSGLHSMAEMPPSMLPTSSTACVSACTSTSEPEERERHTESSSSW